MSKSQSQLTVALLFGALALLTFFGVTFATGMIDFLYRDAAGLSTLRGIAQVAALLAAVGFFAAGFIIAVRAAFQPGKSGQKILHVLPLYLLLFTLAGIVSGLIGVGTVGTLFNLQGIGPITFATAWVALGAILTTIALVIAAARTQLDRSSLRSASIATGAATTVSVVAVIALLLSVAIVSTNQPSIPSFGPPGGQRPGGQGAQNGGGQGAQNGGGQRPGGQGAQNGSGQGGQNGGQPPGGQGAPAGNGVATTPEVSSAPPPATTPEVGSASNQIQAPESTREPGGFQGGQGGRPGEGQGGGFPGGDRGGPGGSTNSVSLYTIGAVLMTIFVVIEVGSAVVALRSLGGAAPTSASIPAANSGSQIGSVLLTFVGITIVGFAVIQLVPVSRDNPPILSAVKWDSPQTQALVERTCMNCHSNETTWPWYASIAPSSWLTSIHVHAARQQLNLSELNNQQGFRRARVFEEMVQQIQAGNMPPRDYLILHPEARLSDAEKQQLIQGLQNTQTLSQ